MATRMDRWPLMRRNFTIVELEECRAEGDAEKADASKRFSIALSSEEPVVRWFGLEVLSHDKKAVNMAYLKANAALLVNHDVDQQVGALRNPRISDDRKIRAEMQFSRSAHAQDIRADVEDEIRTQISVGYSVDAAKLVRQGDQEKGELDEWLVTRWTPYEGSIVAIAADLEAGVGRAMDRDDSITFPVELDDGVAVAEKRGIMPNKEPAATAAAAPAGEPNPAPAVRAAAIEVGASEEQKNIIAACRNYGVPELAMDLIEEGVSFKDAGARILKRISTTGSAVEQARGGVLDMPLKDRKRYLYSRALLGLAEGRLDGVEREVHEMIAAGIPSGYPTRGGVWLPTSLGVRAQRATGALDSATATHGAELVFTEPGDFIDMLRTRMAVARAGATIMTGLRGPIGFPRQTSGATASWVAEDPGSDVGDTFARFDQPTLTPKSLQASTQYSRQLLAQTSLDAEGIVVRDLEKVHQRAIDLAAIHGTGASNQPTGIYAAAGVGSVAFGGNPTYAKLVDMQGVHGDANGSYGRMAYITTPLAAAKMKGALEFPSAPGGMAIWQGKFDQGVVAGEAAFASGQVSKTLGTGSDHGCVYGDMEDLIIGFWEGMEAIVDPLTLKKQALIEVTTFQMADVLLRHGASFVKATTMTAA